MSIITLNVNTVFDENDGTSSGNGLSLRDAIITANNDLNNDYVIQLQGGQSYYLAIAGQDDTSLIGDLDIVNGANVTIKTTNNAQATIFSANSDRLFHVLSGGTLSLEKLLITGGYSVEGGGIYNAGTLNVAQSTIKNNLVTSKGGGIYNYYGTITIGDTTISNNIASYEGGGIWNDHGSLTISNSTISSNSTNGSGGGIYNYYVNILIINTTITNNLSDADNSGFASGGGLYNNQGTFVLRNSIVAGNFDTPNNGGSSTKQPDLSGNFQGAQYNLIGKMTGASGTIGTGTDIVLATGQNAGLGPLQNNGGLTPTHALLSGSPAINAGDNGLIYADIADSDGDGIKSEQAPNDQRGAGYVRISGSSVDIGAFEFQTITVLPTIAINDVTITEGNSGTTNATFTVTRTGTPTNAITVNYATADSTATAGSDYTATTGTLNFATNETSKTITIPIIGDTTIESNETFFVNLSSATNATITDAQGLGTINDNDNTTSGILLIGDDDDNYLIGGSGNDTLQGLGGNDTLNGATGVDSLVGGLGNDIYYVENSGDIVVEASNAGTDIVNTNITYTLPANVENLAMIDSGNVNDNINGTGNTLNNKLTGNSGANTLTGDAGNDSLNGGKGNDTLNGGAGNDTYTVESLNDVIIDSAGVDLVKSSVSWTLATGLENLTLIGSTAINGTGNSVNNIITGNTGVNTLTGLDGNDSLNGDAGNDTLLGGNGNDTLVGGVGNDSLTGGSGLDYFRFNAKTEGIDTISDFVVVDDTIQVAKSSFAGGLVVGTLLTTQFTLGASATTTAHRFGYESGTGKLWFDVDGSGATAATQIATLPTGLGLTNADIVVV